MQSGSQEPLGGEEATIEELTEAGEGARPMTKQPASH